MKPFGMLVGLLLASPVVLAPAPAGAQPAPGLTYVQPLAPGAAMRVQERLRQLGAYSGRADGVWGPDSQAALERFQQGRGLQVTGQLNQATASTLGLSPAELVAAAPGPAAAAAAAPAVPVAPAVPATAAEPLSPAAVRNIQARLRSLGFYRGSADGVWGPGTQAAIERFQQGRGLQATGQLTPATAAAMGLDPNNLAAPPQPR
jgi:peptidoglycan hydrolase-like protein with peptidoglycan-binding domain